MMQLWVAKELGISRVDDWLASITADEFDEWTAFFSIMQGMDATEEDTSGIEAFRRMAASRYGGHRQPTGQYTGQHRTL